ncbi:hypothetical protein Q7P35_007511 [Cladosporium inversicolor]
MVTTRQAARIAQQHGNSLLEDEERQEDAGPQPTHTTSLTSNELRVIHQLCNFQSKNRHHSFDPLLKRHLFRFWCFMPPPHSLRTPGAWNHSSWRDSPDAPLPRAVAVAHVLLSQPGALAPVPAPPEPPIAPALPQTQSPLFSILPPEIRTGIFGLAVTHDGKARVQRACCAGHGGGHVDIAIPALAAVSRLVRKETLTLFFRLNNFTLAPLPDSRGQKISKSGLGKWLAAMRSHLPSLHQLTFEVQRRDKIAGYDSRDVLSVTIRHDPVHNRWITSSTDDWSSKNDADRQSLERDNILLQQILVPMLDQRSRDDFTPDYLMWFMEDLRMFYAGEKLEPKYPPDCHWTLSTRGSRPDVYRPPDMYTRHLEHEYWIQRPYWLCWSGHRLEMDVGGVFRCKCEET